MKLSEEVERSVISRLLELYQVSRDAINGHRFGTAHWSECEQRYTMDYAETEGDIERALRRASGIPDYTTVHIPVSYAAVVTLETYLQSVLLKRDPIFQFTSRIPERVSSASALESLIDYQVNVGEMRPVLEHWLRDAALYGIGIIGCFWDSSEQSLYEDEELFGESMPGEMDEESADVPADRPSPAAYDDDSYEGNRLYNVRPFDFYPDPRFPMSRLQEGTFVITKSRISKNQYVRGVESGIYERVDELFDDSSSGLSSGAFDEDSNEDMTVDDSVSSLIEQNIEIMECYVELIPKDWEITDVERKQSPQKFLFVLANRTYLIKAEPFVSSNNRFPFYVIQPYTTFTSLLSPSIVHYCATFEDTQTWQLSTYQFQHRAIGNPTLVVNPTMIDASSLRETKSGVKMIVLKPGGYGRPLSEAVQQLNIANPAQNMVQDMRTINEIMDRIIGFGPNMQGALNPGGRKSATEVRAANMTSGSRLSKLAETVSSQGFSPLGRTLVQNTQKFLRKEQTVRIVGELSDSDDPFIKVAPDDIKGAYDFKVFDGTAPMDRFAMSNLLREHLMMMSQIPQIGQAYDQSKIFEKTMELAGIREARTYKVQPGPVVSPPMMEGMPNEQSGGGVATGGPNGGGAAPARGDQGVPSPTQVEGLGNLI